MLVYFHLAPHLSFFTSAGALLEMNWLRYLRKAGKFDSVRQPGPGLGGLELYEEDFPTTLLSGHEFVVGEWRKGNENDLIHKSKCKCFGGRRICAPGLLWWRKVVPCPYSNSYSATIGFSFPYQLVKITKPAS